MLNAALIRERRLELGLSRRELARAIGRSVAVIDNLERGTNHDEQTLATVARLADALSVTPADLLEASLASDARPDDVMLEAALVFFNYGLAAETLARGLNWPLPRTRQAIKDLRQRLIPTGQTLRHSGGKFKIVYNRGVLTAEEITRMEQDRVTAFGIGRADAAMLLAVLRGHVTSEWNRNRNGSTHVTIGRLERLGYITPSTNGWRVTPAVEYSLGLRR